MDNDPAATPDTGDHAQVDAADPTPAEITDPADPSHVAPARGAIPHDQTGPDPADPYTTYARRAYEAFSQSYGVGDRVAWSELDSAYCWAWKEAAHAAVQAYDDYLVGKAAQVADALFALEQVADAGHAADAEAARVAAENPADTFAMALEIERQMAANPTYDVG